METIKLSDICDFKAVSNVTGKVLTEIIIKDNSARINIPSVESWNITELRFACKRNKVKGYTKMSREELIVEVKGIIEKFKI